MSVFDKKNFEQDFINKRYVRRVDKPFYILTVKISTRIYLVRVLDNHNIVGECTTETLGDAKKEGIKILYTHNENALNTEILNMVHYKFDRDNRWQKERDEDLNSLFFYRIIGAKPPSLFPPLERKNNTLIRDGYDQEIIDKVVYEYLFKGSTHEYIGKNVLKDRFADSTTSKNIIQSYGLRNQSRGVFKGIDEDQAVIILKSINHNGELNELILLINRLSIEIEHCKSTSQHQKIKNEVYEEGEELEAKEYPEGREAYRLHRYRERDARLIREAKKLFKQKHGRLFCEACNICFGEIYGYRGKDFIEAHHTRPISQMKEGESTRVEDMAILCSNCHRMVHRKPIISVSDLRKLIEINQLTNK